MDLRMLTRFSTDNCDSEQTGMFRIEKEGLVSDLCLLGNLLHIVFVW